MHLKIKSTLLVLLLSLNIFGQEYSGRGEDINKILNSIDAFSKAYIAADYDKLTTFYSTDGKIFPTGADIIVGHKAIKKRWALPQGSKILYHKITPEELKIIDDYAYDYGYYVGSSRNENGVSAFKGKYVIIWKKIDNDWKIYLDIWNKIDENKK